MVDIINNPAIAVYVATAVAVVVMIGFLAYLWNMDRRVRELQRLVERNVRAEGESARPVERETIRPQRIEKELSNGLDRG